MGRPPLYTEELAEEILTRIIKGESLRQICMDDHTPSRDTVHKWIVTKREFSDNYARATKIRAEGYAEEIVSIADDVSLGDARERALMIDARKWTAGRMLPQKYGEKSQLEITGDPAMGNTSEEKRQELTIEAEVFLEAQEESNKRLDESAPSATLEPGTLGSHQNGPDA